MTTVPPWLDLKTVLVLATMAAGFVGQWAVVNDRAAALAMDTARMQAHIDRLDDRIQAVERNDVKQSVQIDNLYNLIGDLRRRASIDGPRP